MIVYFHSFMHYAKLISALEFVCVSRGVGVALYL